MPPYAANASDTPTPHIEWIAFVALLSSDIRRKRLTPFKTT